MCQQVVGTSTVDVGQSREVKICQKQKEQQFTGDNGVVAVVWGRKSSRDAVWVLFHTPTVLVSDREQAFLQNSTRRYHFKIRPFLDLLVGCRSDKTQREHRQKCLFTFVTGNGNSSRSNSSNASRSRSESVLSTSSSNETLRYNENDVGNSFDSNETVIQPPMEFFDNASTAGNSSTGNESVDLKRFPLGTTYQNQLTQNEDSIQVNIIVHQINHSILKAKILIFPENLMIVSIDLKWIFI